MKKSYLSIVIVVLLAIALVGCGKNVDNTKEIVGYWKNDTTLPGFEFIYTFNENGTGNYNSAGTDMPFRYVISDNKISIFYDGFDVPFDTEFEIKGNVLNVKDSNNEDVLYNRISENEAKSSSNELPISQETEYSEEQVGVGNTDEGMVALVLEQHFTSNYPNVVEEVIPTKIRIYTEEEIASDEQFNGYKINEGDIAFEAEYELKIVDGYEDMMQFTAGSGDIDGQWIRNKYNVGIARSGENGYTLDAFGSAF